MPDTPSPLKTLATTRTASRGGGLVALRWLVISAICFGGSVGAGMLWRRMSPGAAQSPASTPSPDSPSGAAAKQASPAKPGGNPTDASVKSADASTSNPVSPATSTKLDFVAERRFGEHFRSGYANFQAERYSAAVKDFEQAVQVAPQLAEGHQMLGESYKMLKLIDQAEAAYRAALARMANFRPAEKELCEILYNSGRHDEALKLLAGMQERTPDDAFVIGELAINHLALGDHQQAAALLDQFIAVNGRDAWGLAHLGRAHELRGDVAAAERLYRESLQLDPYFPKAHHWLGLLLARLNRPDDSRAALAEYERLNNLLTQEHQLSMRLLRTADHGPTLVQLAKTRHDLGKRQQALATLDRAMRSAPPDIRAELLRLRGEWINAAQPRKPAQNE